MTICKTYSMAKKVIKKDRLRGKLPVGANRQVCASLQGGPGAQAAWRRGCGSWSAQGPWEGRDGFPAQQPRPGTPICVCRFLPESAPHRPCSSLEATPRPAPRLVQANSLSHSCPFSSSAPPRGLGGRLGESVPELSQEMHPGAASLPYSPLADLRPPEGQGPRASARQGSCGQPWATGGQGLRGHPR